MAVQIDGSQGNVIATKGTYSGSVSIGGTLTYEDVTNIDSVGIITARTSIEVGARPGVGASISSDGNAIFSGITTITQLGGSPKLTSGQTITSTANDGNASIQGGLTYPGGHIRLGGGSGDDDIRFSVSGGSGTLSERVRIDSSGRLLVGLTASIQNTAYLQLKGANTSDISLYWPQDAATAGSHISWRTDGGGAATETARIFCGQSTTGADGGFMTFLTHNGTSVGERVRIDSSGQVLINQTTGSSKLCVSDTNPVIAEFHHSDGGTNDQARISLGALASNPPSNRGVNLIGENNGAGHDFVVATSPSHSGGPTEKLRITSAGLMGLGTSSPSDALEISHASDPAIRLHYGGNSGYAVISMDSGNNITLESDVSSAGSNSYFSIKVDGTEEMRIKDDGGIFFYNLLGNASSGSNVKYSNSDDELRYDTSSQLLKTNITALTKYGIDTVKKLKPSTYTPQEYNKDGTITVGDETLIGFIADEMVNEVPEVVQMYPKSTLTKQEEDTEIVPAAISYDKLTVVLTKALQEAIAKIETLESEMAALKSS